MSTYQNEQSLPSLPVPELSSTVHQLLIALQPLVSSEEYSQLLNESTEFLNNHLVNTIQTNFLAARHNPRHSCYLNCINDEFHPGIYGELRGDVLPRNPYLVLQEDPYSKFMNPPNQSQRAANLVNSSLKFIVSLRNETLPPDLTPRNKNPLTMNCYRNLFGSTRVPDMAESPHAYHQISIKTSRDPVHSNHIVVVSCNQFYYLPVLSEHQEIFFNDYDLSLIFQQILDESTRFDVVESINNAIGALTTQNYSHWKWGRAELMRSNASSLDLIDKALFVVVLDPNSPTTDQDKTMVISHGTSVLSSNNAQGGSCTSRWYDKLQLIVTKNSVAGVVWECTSSDSTAILRFISDIYTDSILKLAKNINAIEYSLFGDVRFVSNKLPKPSFQRLVFKKTPELSNLIHLSETRLADLINQHSYTSIKIKLNTELLNSYGVSTDSFLQVCIQIANYSLYGKVSNTLEPITTRKFKDSRTEMIAVQNDEIANLVKLFITNSSRAEKWSLFERCCKIHLKQYTDAMQGKGFERHLTSLLHVIKSPKASEFLNTLNAQAGVEKLPEFDVLRSQYVPLLSNPILNRILSPELLISNCGNPALYLFGIPPPTDQGFGIGYVIHKDKVLLTLCSKFRQNERFLSTLVKIINEVKAMVVSRSDFLVEINKDNDYRIHELQKLRVEQELKNLNFDSPSTKHPIEISVDSFTIPLDMSLKHQAAPDTDDELDYESSNSNNSAEFDYLGGYGYFDFGELDSRNIELNRSQSFLNSPSNLSSLSSRNPSQHNLSVLAKNLDLKEKHDLNERIREKLNKSADDLPRFKSPESPTVKDPQIEKGNPKHKIGRPLNISK
ncbi:carnitine O-acetyltransferase [Yamadazyma tenuis]|uniref:Choline/carnitine acyltransferase domain-containing protein n=1 Tax=Candida tenuis (strain ATCC 10573 / BCRC 21748 / CBS 615 / JCM 9827 / NBRC 10315 / NRRL Y-1498 / VKM Y-70) TaxID=590646 RepID=G3B2T4_CANTC|nr:uncharacterized protein CANTEDRAFT_120712 [Yamadazyma tenuis ATCC 10573]EGV64756.1 hypothetical protein CANTEDRAFT_120712 [Yamadazyma tenuis ATCC 10573]WEJ97546.1 carnitine O-acetyltransferase [Yamadazyma tenuis]